MDAIDTYGEVVYSGKLGEFNSVSNQNPAINSQIEYWAVTGVFPNGREFNALFTTVELERAMKRAIKNPEDIPKKLSLWNKLKLWVKSLFGY